MRAYRVGVPPGVGDVYWCLTKLQALRERVGASAVELCVQHAGPGRSTAWAEMVDFIDRSSFHAFKPGEALKNGFLSPGPGVDCVLWPNAIVDRGQPLADWLPELPLDLDFPVRTQSYPGPPRVLVYASSQAINKAWVPNLGPRYWIKLIQALGASAGPVTLIGAGWDKPFSQELQALARRSQVQYEDLTDKTSLPQVAHLLKHARVLVGVISGMTILANHFRTPTVALYPRAHHPDFPRSWVADGAPYEPILASDAPPAVVLAARASRLARASGP